MAKRKIDFRGKCTEAVSTHHEGVEVGEWVQGFLIEHNKIRITLSEEHGGMGPGFGYYHIKVNPKSVGEFSGLFDTTPKKNKIFEGDIVKYFLPKADNEQGEDEYIEEVVYADGMFCCENVPLFATLDWKVEVIGNVLDNPELLANGIQKRR